MKGLVPKVNHAHLKNAINFAGQQDGIRALRKIQQGSGREDQMMGVVIDQDKPDAREILFGIGGAGFAEENPSLRRYIRGYNRRPSKIALFGCERKD